MRLVRAAAAALVIATTAPAAAAPASLHEVVRRAARHQGLPEPLLLGLAAVESGFRPRVVSAEHAVGLLQVQPATARAIGCRGALTDPVANAECGGRYLRLLLGRARGDTAQALAAYNMGPAGCRRRPGPGLRYAARVMAAARTF